MCLPFFPASPLRSCSYLYALVLLPVGVLCDRLPRPKLLAAGVATWSLLTLAASSATNFAELLAARVGFAAAQAVQNPVSFALSEWRRDTPRGFGKVGASDTWVSILAASSVANLAELLAARVRLCGGAGRAEPRAVCAQ